MTSVITASEVSDTLTPIDDLTVADPETLEVITTLNPQDPPVPTDFDPDFDFSSFGSSGPLLEAIHHHRLTPGSAIRDLTDEQLALLIDETSDLYTRLDQERQHRAQYDAEVEAEANPIDQPWPFIDTSCEDDDDDDDFSWPTDDDDDDDDDYDLKDVFPDPSWL